MGFSRQEYWSGLPCPPPGDLPNPGIEPAPLMSPAVAGGFFTTCAPWEALMSQSLGCVYLGERRGRRRHYSATNYALPVIMSAILTAAQSPERLYYSSHWEMKL